jgi:endonuclease III
MRRPPAARAAEVVRRLLRAYPAGHPARPDAAPVASKGPTPLEELIFTLLSQNTSDVNRDRAWTSLRRKYPTWDAVAKARTPALVASIKMGGLADTKAPRIKAVLREVHEREGAYSLERLRKLPDDEARDYLLSLPGIGPKTAACVLAFSLGRDRLPVDTHVHRLAQRLGFAGAKASPEETQNALEVLVPGPKRVQAHVTLIAHGRTTCTAQRPRCAACVLADLCPSAALFLAEGGEPGTKAARKS